MLVVQGGPTTAVVRSRCGESVVLLSGELPCPLTDASVAQVLDVAAAVLDPAETALFRRCLARLRASTGARAEARRIEVNGAVLTVHAA